MKTAILLCLTMVACIGCSSLREGIYIGQHWSIIEVAPDDTLIVQDIRIDSNSISAVSWEDSGYIYQLKGRYRMSSNKLFVEAGDSIKLIGTVDEHNIMFGESLPEQKWSRWYAGTTLTDYKMYKSRLVQAIQDIALFSLYALALEAAAYKNRPSSELGGNGSYAGFEEYIDKYGYVSRKDDTNKYLITMEKDSTIRFQANSLLIPGAYVSLQLDENGRIISGPNTSGW